MQARVGVQEQARRVGNGTRSSMPAAAQDFLRGQPILVVASVDAEGRRWASLLTGPPGFARALDTRTVEIVARPAPGDPLIDNLRPGAPIGLLAIEFATRRRMRLNGVVEAMSAGSGREPGAALTLRVHAEQVYANCPKYIQAREWTATPGDEDGGGTVAPARTPLRGRLLTADQRRWVERADTFFIATAHPEGGADASHRGGLPGFVRVEGASRLLFPDYAGNMVFNTLGNIVSNPGAGLVFVDFERRATLQLTGRAEVIWDPEGAPALVGAERVVAFEIEEVVETADVALPGSRFVEYSPFNPS
jgi:predicted pyridoxine 5'-phosphate oxidase superfamily flavin-nucleotide-binding protein